MFCVESLAGLIARTLVARGLRRSCNMTSNSGPAMIMHNRLHNKHIMDLRKDNLNKVVGGVERG